MYILTEEINTAIKIFVIYFANKKIVMYINLEIILINHINLFLKRKKRFLKPLKMKLLNLFSEFLVNILCYIKIKNISNDIQKCLE